MIVAAGLGTRLRPLTELRPKPAVPVRGLPLLAYPLSLLARHGVTEVMINTHRLPDVLMEAARRVCPPGIALHFSHERELLDTGGGIGRVAEFLRASDPCLVLGGDMLLELDLTALCRRHRERGDAATLALLRDPRAAQFGSIGVAQDGGIRRIGQRFDLGGEVDSGLYVWANVFSPRAFDHLPARDRFSHLDHWIAPWLASGARNVRGEVMSITDCAWQPVGTLSEYLAANFSPDSRFPLHPGVLPARQGTRLEAERVVGAGAQIGAGASLRRSVIWDGERVPAGLRASDGVFAGGTFHSCHEDTPK